VRARGAPSTAAAAIFAAGAIVGFCLIDQLIDLLGAETLGPMKPINRCQDRVLAGRVRLDRGRRGAGRRVPARRRPRPGRWLVALLAATALCLLIASVQPAAVAAREG
jgi:hypothetical protein